MINRVSKDFCKYAPVTSSYTAVFALGFALALASQSCKSRETQEEDKPTAGIVPDQKAAAQALADGPNLVGQWSQPLTPSADSKDVNPVHALLLPSGRILMIGGSSNRNFAAETGIEVSDASRLFLVDNAAIFDPVNSTWKRVPGIPNSVRTNFTRAKQFGVDPFCGAQMLLSDGRVLFAGGTLSYRSNFQGARLLWTFDEKTETWTEMPPLGEGRWYPTLLALSDGRIAAVSGLNGGASRTISNTMDIIDPKTNTVANINLAGIAGYPYGGGNPLDHYPRILPLQNGKWIITADGTGIGPVNRKSTTIMEIASNNKVTFTKGPDRPLVKRLYGTALVDPNSPQGDVLLIGGMAGVGDSGVVTPRTHPVTPSLTALERYDAAANSWASNPNFLGTTKEDARIGHYSIILPTGQFLVVNGSNYVQNRGTYNPLLFTPSGPKAYTSRRMQRAQYPRFYHNVALLLPDGRVWVNGSNRDRARVLANATVEQGNIPPGAGSDPDVAKTDLAWLPPGARIEKEFTKVEIFSPPYLFNASGQRIAESDRPQITNAPAQITRGSAGVAIKVTGAGPGGKANMIKFGSSTHAWDMGQKFVPLSVKHNGGDSVEVTLPSNANQVPPGHYHLFYVNKDGVPSIGKTIVVNPQ